MKLLNRFLNRKQEDDSKAPSLADAEAIHRAATIVILHDHVPVREDLNDCLAGGVAGKVIVPVLDTRIEGDFAKYESQFSGWAAHAQDQFNEVRADIGSSDGKAFLAKTGTDFERAHREGRFAVMLGSEGAKLLEGEIEKLEHWHGVGLRQLQLNWMWKNQVAGAFADTDGLSGFGQQVIDEANRLGIIIDVTHSSAVVIDEVIEKSRHPVIFSHALVYGGFAKGSHADQAFGYSDDTISRLAKRGGLLGVHFLSCYYNCDENGESDIQLQDVLDHIDHAVSIMGVDHVALGCDYFPDHGNWADMMRTQGYNTIRFVADKADFQQVTAGLLRRRYSEQDVIKILGGNYLRVCREVMG